MTLTWLLASLHLVALGVGVAAIAVRARALRRLESEDGLASVFMADNWWGVAAVLWLVTGLWRLLGGLEKDMTYYFQHPLFHAKLGLFVLIVILEIWPMMALLRWRMAVRRSATVSLERASQFARISSVQLVLVVIMVFLASAVARGFGA